MENLLLKYMGGRLEHFEDRQLQQGPVITISRECGCPGNDVAELLKEKLNQKMISDGFAPKWRWVNKEILLKAAEELKINPIDVEAYLKAEENGIIQDLVASFTETYHIRNAKITKVIHDVIRNLAINGYVIIVGRGGGSIAWDIPKSLHLSLEAPLSWKTANISKLKGISLGEARSYVLQRDQQRLKFREHFRAKYADEIFYHQKFNCKSLNAMEMSQLAFEAAILRNLV